MECTKNRLRLRARSRSKATPALVGVFYLGKSVLYLRNILAFISSNQSGITIFKRNVKIKKVNNGNKLISGMIAASVNFENERMYGTTTIKQKIVIHPNFFNLNKTNIIYGEKSRIIIFKIKKPMPAKKESESSK